MNSRLVRVDWLPFHIPYAAAFTTAHGRETVRSGVIIRVALANGLEGLGEASPLPAFGGGTLDDTLACVARLAPGLLGRTPGAAAELLGQAGEAQPGMAAALCGLDTALLDVDAQAAGLPLARWLAPGAAEAVPVNAAIGAADAPAACAAARRAIEAGIGCVKLKVGVAATSAAEIERIAAVRAAIGPGPRLRLDANAAWDVATATAIIGAAERYGLDLVEQPVAAGDLAGMAAVRAAVRTPIAADEAVGGPAQARRVIAAGAADVLVLKPMMAGGLRRGRAIIALAQAAGMQTIVTTTIDSGVGVAAALHLAATLPAPPPACGLATGTLLAGDLLVQPVIIRNGAIRLPVQPGLGVRLDERQLARYAGEWRQIAAERT